ncbi:MAG TPA: hypothetical protein VNF04_04090 [Stellaceae bacterium]|nr:hypothetical protein [Stellaceae bacterium]
MALRDPEFLRPRLRLPGRRAEAFEEAHEALLCDASLASHEPQRLELVDIHAERGGLVFEGMRRLRCLHRQGEERAAERRKPEREARQALAHALDRRAERRCHLAALAAGEFVEEGDDRTKHGTQHSDLRRAFRHARQPGIEARRAGLQRRHRRAAGRAHLAELGDDRLATLQTNPVDDFCAAHDFRSSQVLSEIKRRQRRGFGLRRVGLALAKPSPARLDQQRILRPDAELDRQLLNPGVECHKDRGKLPGPLRGNPIGPDIDPALCRELPAPQFEIDGQDLLAQRQRAVALRGSPATHRV